MRKKRIGLFGGTFDPVHTGHLTIARQAAQEACLNQVIFIPAADPPHKKKPGAAYGHRVAMLEAALAEDGDQLLDATERGAIDAAADALRTARQGGDYRAIKAAIAAVERFVLGGR